MEGPFLPFWLWRTGVLPYHWSLHYAQLGATSLLVKPSSHLGSEVLQINPTTLGAFSSPRFFLLGWASSIQTEKKKLSF